MQHDLSKRRQRIASQSGVTSEKIESSSVASVEYIQLRILHVLCTHLSPVPNFSSSVSLLRPDQHQCLFMAFQLPYFLTASAAALYCKRFLAVEGLHTSICASLYLWYIEEIFIYQNFSCCLKQKFLCDRPFCTVVYLLVTLHRMVYQLWMQ